MYDRVPKKLQLQIGKRSAYCTINSKPDNLTIFTLMYWAPYRIFKYCVKIQFSTTVQLCAS